MKYYIDSNGNYLGGTDGEPLSSNEAPTAPNNARETWDGAEWNDSQEMIDDAAKERATLDKLNGVDFNGVMCSATSKDMWGLRSVRDWVVAGSDVNFEFENGNKLVLTSVNVAAFEAVWIPFRASFF